MKLNGKKIAILIILVLFLAGLFFRVQLDGLNPTHPGNLKAANAFYHVIAADHVANTGEIFGNPSWDAEGHNDVTSIVAQHQAVMIAPLIKLTGIEEWNLSYLIVVILSALAIPITYMLTRRLFKSEITSIIAAGLIVIPIQITNWLYYLYIGIWLQSSVTPFLLLSIVFIIDLFKELKLWKIVALSITTTATFLMFPPVMIFFFPLLLVILWKILTEKIENKEKIKKFIGYAIIPIISLIIFMPILMFGDLGSASQDEKLFEFGPPNYESAPFAKGIESIPWILLIFGGYGLLLLLMNYKKYKGVILWMAYMGAILYILPYFMHGHTGYYLLRMRGGFLIYLLAPIIAYGIYHLGIKNISKVFKSKLILTILALILLIGAAVPAHGLLKEQLAYEHIPEDKYEVMLWVQENVPEGENMLVLEGDYQLSGTYFKRNRFTLDQEQLITYLTGISQGQDPNTINGFWSGYADWGKWSKRTGYFSFEKYEPLSKTQQITNFNYVFMEHLSPEIGEINGQLISWLTQHQGYEIIYNQGRFTILGKQNGN